MAIIETTATTPLKRDGAGISATGLPLWTDGLA